MLILAEGLVDILATPEGGGAARSIARRHPGQPIGEMSLLTGGRRSATARALTDVVAFEIAREHLEPLLESRPGLAGALSWLVAERNLQRAQARPDAAGEPEAPGDPAPVRADPDPHARACSAARSTPTAAPADHGLARPAGASAAPAVGPGSAIPAGTPRIPDRPTGPSEMVSPSRKWCQRPLRAVRAPPRTDRGAGQGSATGAAGALRASLTGAAIGAETWHGLHKGRSCLTQASIDRRSRNSGAWARMIRVGNSSDTVLPKEVPDPVSSVSREIRFLRKVPATVVATVMGRGVNGS